MQLQNKQGQRKFIFSVKEVDMESFHCICILLRLLKNHENQRGKMLLKYPSSWTQSGYGLKHCQEVLMSIFK